MRLHCGERTFDHDGHDGDDDDDDDDDDDGHDDDSDDDDDYEYSDMKITSLEHHSIGIALIYN